MRRRMLTIAIVWVFALSALAFAQQVQRTSSSENPSVKSITVGVHKTSQSEESSGEYAAQRNVSYNVRVADEAGNPIAAPVNVVVSLPETHLSAKDRWDETGEMSPEDALPAAQWGVLVPLTDDFAQAPPRSASGIGLDRSTAPVPMLANIVYSYETPEVSGYRQDAESYYESLQETVIQFYSMSCAEFRPLDSGQSFRCDAWELMATNVVGSNGFIAPVHLPDGVKVTELKVWVYDNDSRGDLVATLDAVELGDTDSYYAMAELFSEGRGGIQELVSYGIQNSTIDNSVFKYTLTVTGFSGTAHHRLLGARLEYETTVGGAPIPENALQYWR